MPDRPLILFPSPERADREHKTPVFTRTVRPSFGRQFTRLQTSLDKGTQRKTTENELPSLTQCTA